jgi:hypothetical protein
MTNSNDKQIRRSRPNIFLGDFKDARRFANYILSRNLHKSDDPESITRLKLLAFNASVIVSYCRPFHGSNDQEGARKVSLKQDLAAFVLDASEFDLHKRIIAKRDQEFAHSDSVAHEFNGYDYSGRVAMFYKLPREPLTKEETQTLRSMIRKWIKHIETLREGAGE